MESDRGLLFVASGDAYVSEAVETARQISNLDVTYPLAIVSDTSADLPEFDHLVDLSDPSYDLRDKPAALPHSPFEETVYLDTDVHVTDAVVFDELFDILERVSVAATFDICRSERERLSLSGPEEPPPSFPMLNTGVLAYRQSAVDDLFARWLALYDEYEPQVEGGLNDQVPFRQALWESDVEYGVLTSEYNTILPSPQFLADEARILHGDVANRVELADALNERTPLGGRVYHPVYNDVEAPDVRPWVAGANQGAPLRQLLQSLTDFGPGWTLLYYLAGGDPLTGRRRIERFREITNDRGLPVAVAEAIGYLLRDR